MKILFRHPAGVIYTTIKLLFVLFWLTLQVKAQSQGSPKANSYTGRVAVLKQEITLNPDKLELHEEFIDSVSRDSALLTMQYAQWINDYPKSSIVPFAIARYYNKIESPKIKPYLLKAVDNNPKLADAWRMLSNDAERWGQVTESQVYLKKLVEIDPRNPVYQLEYAASFLKNDFKKFLKLCQEIVDNFPKSEQAARALYWMGKESSDNKDRIRYFGLLISRYPSSEFRITSYALQVYFDALLCDNIENALHQAKIMQTGKHDRETWNTYVAQAEQIVRVNALLAENKGPQALSEISDIHLDKWMEFNKTLFSMKAKAYSLQGMNTSAYQYLIETFLQRPSPELRRMVDFYGRILGKDPNGIGDDIRAKIDSIAQPAHPFSLKKSIGNDTVSLSDYRGKVVLISYWFPGCGPCRAEFPHFENVIKRIKSKDLSYLTLNIVPSQNAYITPFLKKTGYSFLSLDDPGYRKREKGNLDNKGFAPVNFLIDKQGRLIFSRFQIDASGEDDLELMINTLLENSIN